MPSVYPEAKNAFYLLKQICKTLGDTHVEGDLYHLPIQVIYEGEVQESYPTPVDLTQGMMRTLVEMGVPEQEAVETFFSKKKTRALARNLYKKR